jgi:hypothetical protein
VVNEIITVKVANAWGDVIRSKRQVWADYDSPIRNLTYSETLESAWLIMPMLERSEWHVVKFGGNWRHRKVWLESYDGRYTMYASYQRVKV